MKNKNKVVALKYEQGDYSPVIVAKGEDQFAQKILELAKVENIPILEEKGIVETLYKFEINQYIPEDLWDIVADIYLFIFENYKKF